MNRKDRIEQTLKAHLNPVYIEVVDESNRHHVPENAQTHFKVTAVSVAFEGMSLIKRHRLVNSLVEEERTNGMHALSLHLKTPEEWEKQSTTPNSPACKDGFKHG
ncbi:BolA family protein [Legionella sp. W05-934-2]|jgi:BolA protein|uniref:BolA family protein n=1 Tax=Legionella sp. W05-934-2 TaxID=1198649 RepID=UPI003462B0D2